jgi:hypothetical protein
MSLHLQMDAQNNLWLLVLEFGYHTTVSKPFNTVMSFHFSNVRESNKT